VIFLHDHAWLRTAQQTWSLIQNFGWQMLDCHLCSPASAHSDFHLFSVSKDQLSVRHFTCDEDVKYATIAWLTWQKHTFYTSGMGRLITCSDRCLSNEGDYVEK
jgi:hypothetical protein